MDIDKELDEILKRKAMEMVEQMQSSINVPGKIIELTYDSLKEIVANSSVPVFIDLWAPWCGPCRAVAPIMEQLAKEYGDKIQFTKLNMEEYPAVGEEFKVMSIPTFLMFKDGKLATRFIGAMPKPKFKAQIDKVLKDE